MARNKAPRYKTIQGHLKVKEVNFSANGQNSAKYSSILVILVPTVFARDDKGYTSGAMLLEG